MFAEINLPDIGTEEVEVTEILVKVGEKISVEQLLITVESEKTLMEVVAPFSGKIEEIKISQGDKIKTGSLIMVVSKNFCKSLKKEDIKINNKKDKFKKNIYDRKKLIENNLDNDLKDIYKFCKNSQNIHASPLIRRLAYKFNINLNYIVGSGPKNRIMYEDIQQYIKKAIQYLEKNFDGSLRLSKIKNFNKVNFSNFGKIKTIDLTNFQKKSGKNLSRNWINIPHVTIMEDIDITDLEDFRKKQNEKMLKLNKKIKITPLIIVTKAVSQVLKEMPIFNSSFSEDNKKIILKKYIHIGIAVETPDSLSIPVIRNVDQKGIIEISKEIVHLSKKARLDKLNISDTKGSSFTISSLGNIGTTHFTPIINAPEVAILGISRSSIKPIWNGEKFNPRLILPISLSFDHRIINGADAVRFINRVSELINDIRLLIL